MRRRLLVLALLGVALALGANWARSPGAAPPGEASQFMLIAWGQPNLRAHIVNLAKHFRHVEVDLMLDRRGVLIGAHDPEKLARVNDGSSPNPLTLPQLLSLPFERVFLDMKDTLMRRSANDTPPDGTTLEYAERAVATAFDSIIASERRDDVFVMVYHASDEMVARAREQRTQLMLQGYPKNDAESLEIVRTAARYGLRHVCIPLARLTQPVLEESRRSGISHIPYTFFQEDWSTADYQRIFEDHLAGLILPPGSGQRRFLEIVADD